MSLLTCTNVDVDGRIRIDRGPSHRAHDPKVSARALSTGRCCIGSERQGVGESAVMPPRRPSPPCPASAFAGFRFPPDVIVVAVRWYLRYGLSYRDVEELLAERGVDVDHVTVYRWVQRFTPLLIDAARPCRHAVGDRWFVDETYVKVAGVWRYVYRAVDQFGQVIDVYVSRRRDLAAARRFFERASATTADRLRWSRTRRRRCSERSTSCSPTPATTRSATRTIASRATTAGSRPGCGPCAACSATGPPRS